MECGPMTNTREMQHLTHVTDQKSNQLKLRMRMIILLAKIRQQGVFLTTIPFPWDFIAGCNRARGLGLIESVKWSQGHPGTLLVPQARSWPVNFTTVGEICITVQMFWSLMRQEREDLRSKIWGMGRGKLGKMEKERVFFFKNMQIQIFIILQIRSKEDRRKKFQPQSYTVKGGNALL